MQVTVVTIQMNSTPDVDQNLHFLTQQFAKIKHQGACLVVLPECFACFGGQENRQLQVAETYGNGPIQDFIAHQAKKYNLWIVAGSMPIKANKSEKIYAASLVFSPDGQCQARYHKMHLFDAQVSDATGRYQESLTTQPGEQVVVVDTPFAKVGLSVCYDVRFPELYRAMQQQGADIICIPSAFTYVTGQAHWEVLMRARAIENQCFIVAANQTGKHQNGRQTWGHSILVDGWGDIVHQQKDELGLQQSVIQIDSLTGIRRRMPNLDHRKLHKD